MIYMGTRFSEKCDSCKRTTNTMEISIGDVEFNVCNDCGETLAVMINDRMEDYDQ